MRAPSCGRVGAMRVLARTPAAVHPRSSPSVRAGAPAGRRGPGTARRAAAGGLPAGTTRECGTRRAVADSLVQYY